MSVSSRYGLGRLGTCFPAKLPTGQRGHLTASLTDPSWEEGWGGSSAGEEKEKDRLGCGRDTRDQTTHREDQESLPLGSFAQLPRTQESQPQFP